MTQRVSQIDCAPPRAQTIAGGTVQTLPTGYAATIDGDTAYVTIGTGITGGSEPDAGAVVSILLRDILGGLIGPLDGSRLLVGVLQLDIIDPPSDGSDVVAWAAIAGTADTSGGYIGCGIKYASTRVMTALRETTGGAEAPLNSTVITGHVCTMQAYTDSDGHLSAVMIIDGPTDNPGTVERGITGYAAVAASGSYLQVGAYSPTVPGAPITVGIRARARYLPAAL